MLPDFWVAIRRRSLEVDSLVLDDFLKDPLDLLLEALSFPRLARLLLFSWSLSYSSTLSGTADLE